MKGNILYIHDCTYLNQSEIDILKKNFNDDELNNINKIYKIIERKKYNYIIIDLEFGNRMGDKISIDLRKNILNLPPLIAVYRFHKPGLYKNNYNLSCFNNISTIPITNWENFLNETKPIYLNTKKKWEKWLENEKLFSNQIYKNIYSINRKK